MINTGTNTGKAAFAAALAAVVVGAGVLAGWFFGLEFLKRIAPGLVAMNPATAAAFILAGASLALFLWSPQGNDQKSRARILTARLCALVVALIGLAKLADILCDCDLNVDQWLFASQLSDNLRFTNRMAPNTAFSFLLLGSALLFVDVKNRSARFCAEFSVVLVGLGSLLAVLAYAYDIHSFYSLGAFIPMALPTAITFSVLAFAFLLSHTDGGLLAILAGDSGAGGTMARRLLPAAIIVPAVFGWLALKGEQVGIYHGAFGDAVEAVGNIFVFTFLVCWSAKRLFNADLGRKKAEEALRESQGLYHSLVEQLPANVWRKDTEGRYIFVNSRFCKSKGRTADEIVGQTAAAINPRELAEQADKEHDLIMRTGESIEKEEFYPQPDGTVKYLQVIKAPVFAADGKIIGTQGIQFDITQRKRAEEALRESQARFKFIFDSVPLGLSLVLNRPDGTLTRLINDAHLHICGLTREQADIRENFLRISHPDDRLRQAELSRQVNEGKANQFSMEKRYVTLDGRLVWVVFSYQRRNNPDGSFEELTTVVDITERKRAEVAVRESQALYLSLVEQLPAGIFRKDAAGRYVFVNVPFCQVMEMSADQILGKTAVELVACMTARRPLAERLGTQGMSHHELIMQTGRQIVVEDDYQGADGRHSYYHTVKSAVFDAAGQIIGSQGILFDITGRKRAEAALKETSALLEALLQNTTDKIYFKDLQSRFVRFSQQCLEIFHLTQPAELKGKTDFDFFSEEHARPAFEAEQEIIRTGKPIFNLEEKETHRDGRVSWALTSKMAWRDQAGNVIGTMGISRDITARKRMEEQLFQSQKMETVGKLAGGVAHEFNSILTAIICQSELLLEDLPAGSPLAENATEIRSAAERAAVLTRQLLAYGRKQFLQPEVLDLNAVLAGLESALRHLLGPGADVRLAPAAGLKAVKADAGQLEQVIMNLAMNARDAMPNGGQLTLETANVTLDQEYVSRFPELKAGDYVMLAITDTGMGMSEEVKARVFEPFFTTKDVGQGTGLGLSTCYGILKQSGGHISVYSELARGATFKIYLPPVEPQTKIPLQRLASPDLPRGTETILLVEDDPAMREMAATLLRRLGYTVLAAANGVEALRLKQQRGSGHIDLLFTDVVMPHMSGKELADRVQALSPHTRILFTSGYTENTIVQQGGLNPGAAFLQKPFTPSALARKVREVLDEPGVPQPATAQ
ncbi:MAG TPA: hypothetical protein DCQ92_11985 [Verrucomicrobia subdivision 3 bacterium]|nr:hypothetical protein [Limisphaerales bacterium]